MNDAIRMQLSAFIDGELQDVEADLLLRRLSQNAELRREVAEYLALGRMIRSDPGLAAVDQLHERIAAAIDERPVIAAEVVDKVRTTRAIRPLAGIAVAATVALVAIFALQSTSVDELPANASMTVSNDVPPSDVVPNVDAQQERQRLYFRNHAETSSALGANGMNPRVVTLRFSEEIIEEIIDNPESDNPDRSEATIEAAAQP